MPPASASAAVRSYAPTDQSKNGQARQPGVHSWTWTWGSLLRRHLIGDPVAGRSCLLGSNWSLVLNLSEVLGGSSALTCLIFFPNMEALVSMTNTTFLGTAGRSLGAK